MRRWAVVLLAVCIGLAAVWAKAAPTVNNYGPFTVSFYNNGDNNGSATGQQDWTAAQMQDVAASILAWDQSIINAAGRQIQMHIFWVEFGTTGSDQYILGGAYSPSNGDGNSAWSYPEHVWRDGVNYDGRWDGWDLMIKLDITAGGVSWNFGSAAPSGGQIDFRSVLAHEVGHALGFFSTYDSTRRFDDWGNTWGTESDPYGWAGYRGLTEWDKNLIDQRGNRPKVGARGTPRNFDQTGDVFLTGASAVAYYGSNVPVYAPSPYNAGSSLSHLDVPGILMGPFLATGVIKRGPSLLEWNVMKDMGWNIDPVQFLLGDANRDSVVSADDYASVQTYFGYIGAPGFLGDANRNGVVSADDFASIQTHFGNHLPEPTMLALLFPAGLVLSTRSRLGPLRPRRVN